MFQFAHINSFQEKSNSVNRVQWSKWVKVVSLQWFVGPILELLCRKHFHDLSRYDSRLCGAKRSPTRLHRDASASFRASRRPGYSDGVRRDERVEKSACDSAANTIFPLRPRVFLSEDRSGGSGRNDNGSFLQGISKSF